MCDDLIPVTPRQLPLDLLAEPRLEAEDFLVGPANSDAFTMIESWPAWPDRLLLLIGPEGSGKTHLAAIWAQRTGAHTLSAAELTLQRVEELAQYNALVLEDADRTSLDEHALFHLLNVVRREGASMLITARTQPEVWGIVTPDLLSRLRLSPCVAIAPPDDALLRAVLVKLFVDRQLIVDTNVVEALGRRMERSLAAARELVEVLDREALSDGRRITRTFALSVLERLETCANADDV